MVGAIMGGPTGPTGGSGIGETIGVTGPSFGTSMVSDRILTSIVSDRAGIFLGLTSGGAAGPTGAAGTTGPMKGHRTVVWRENFIVSGNTRAIGRENRRLRAGISSARHTAGPLPCIPLVLRAVGHIGGSLDLVVDFGSVETGRVTRNGPGTK
jgi:hypothetical protein